MPRPEVPQADALAGEILGAPIEIDHAPGLAQGRLTGVLVDETMQTFVVRPAGSARTVRIAKAGLTGTIFLEGRPAPLNGDTLRVRPEDRTKRLAARGRRS